MRRLGVPIETLWLAAAAFAAGCGSDEPLIGPSFQEAPDAGNDVIPFDAGNEVVPLDAGPPIRPPPLAADIDIVSVALYQTLKIELARGGAPQAPSLPVIAGRAALLRIFVAPQPGFQVRTLRAELDISVNGALMATRPHQILVEGPSTEDARGSTFNFSLRGADLSEDSAFQVRLVETGQGAERPPGSGALYPAHGAQTFGAVQAPGPLEVVLVPYRYQADGSNRLPDTSPAQVQRYHDLLAGRYPVQEVQIQVREAVDWPRAVRSWSSAGFSRLLESMLQLREADGAAPSTYYYGLVAPASSRSSFCRRGCVTGLSTVVRATTPAYYRGSVGLGFGGEASAETLVHELGHAHGRRHAPCGAGSPDDEFPHADGIIATWGYDSTRDLLIPPSTHDMMGYCKPRWVSDYTYQALFERHRTVYQMPLPARRPEPQVWRSILVGTDGPETLGPPLRITPWATPNRSLPIFDIHGAPLGQTDAFFSPFADAEGGILLVREPDGAAQVSIDGERRAFSQTP